MFCIDILAIVCLCVKIVESMVNIYAKLRKK